MTVYDYMENSADKGKPIELFEFRYGAQRFHYTNADRDIFAAGANYKRLAISRSGINQSGEKAQDDMSINLPADNPIVDLFKFSAPYEPVYALIRAMHYGGGDTPLIWVGKATSVSRPQEGIAILTCRTLTASMISSSARLTWDRNCPHMLYDEGCKVDRYLHADNVVVASIDGLDVTVTGLAHTSDDYYSAGFVEWLVSQGTYERRGIERQLGNVLKIFGSMDGITVGMNLTAFPGCVRTAQVCNDKFNNIENYGGFPHLPGDSPFDGDPVF